VGGPVFRIHVTQKLPKHIAETVDGVELQTVGLAAQWWQRVIGTKNVRGTIDQKDVVAWLWSARFGICGHVLAGM
jgi:hypothetical protein